MQTSSSKTTVWILGDQLNPKISSLAGIDKSAGVILMIESLARARQRPYHKQKLVLIWSAMRHFALELQALGYVVDYYEAQPTVVTALAAHFNKYHPAQVRLMETAEYQRSEQLARIVKAFDVPVEITPNNMFLSDRDEFAGMARGKKSLLLENFYRRMRRQTGLLMDGDKPEGGRWNYDPQNRQRPPADQVYPQIPCYAPDQITEAVIELVKREFSAHFGAVDHFWLPVTRPEANHFANDFFENRLDLFGPYEDTIVMGQPALYHSLLSSLLNIGLLEPLAVCRQAEARYQAGLARLNSVEGFIRQIIGWREFVYQVYHLKMPAYADSNYFLADLPLPDFYWTGQTDMACMADAVNNLRRYGSNHHIQRLMITGNFALIAGINPQAVNEWYWLAYTDAYEWVVTPNVLGLALYADGGLLATKPYAASANYINQMSNCCRHCYYQARQTVGERACPFNALYWDFLARNYDQLKQNPRMNLVMSLFDQRDPQQMKEIRQQAADIQQKLRQNEQV
jgi:deoxyribodipyrimidine photolyase-related protein